MHSQKGIIIQRKRARKIVSALERLYPKSGAFLNFKNPWELLVAVILSAQCTDKKVNEVTQTLFKKYRTLAAYVNANPREFELDIRPTGFYRSKTKNILSTARIVRERFGGKVPRTMEELLTLPGVGRKTANIVLELAYGIVVGIPVDTHVRRLARIWNLTRHNDPNRIEQDLMMLIPKKDWPGISYRMVAYGREYCPAKKHDHAQCPISKIRV